MGEKPNIETDADADPIDVNAVIARIRAELTRRQEASASVLPPSQESQITRETDLRWSRLERDIRLLEQHVQMGPPIPDWQRAGRVKQFIARLTARSIVFLSSFLLNWQKETDAATLRSLRTLSEGLSQLKTQLGWQERRLSALLDEARSRLPERFNQEQLERFVEEDEHRLDALYEAFEERFRGTREEIKERLKVYLPLLQQLSLDTATFPIIDLGCGRGEWLEVLHEEGFVCHGIEQNRVFVEQCQQRGLTVREDDACAYLSRLPEASVSVVTGFHLIEHLPFERLLTLFDETVRVLQSGGVAIFETPNPQNLLVGSCSFYLDPTHRNPLPSPVIEFLAQARGLSRVAIWNLHPRPEAEHLPGSENAPASPLAQQLHDYLYGPQDYAVIGWKV